MNPNTAYMSLASISSQDAYDDQIIKEVWSKDFSNFSAQQAQNNCEAVYERMGANAYNRCYQAGVSCKNDATCNELAKKYSAAILKGYSKDFESFKKRSGTISTIGEVGGNILGNLLNKLQGKEAEGGEEYDAGADYATPQPKSKTGLIIGITLGGLAVIGGIIYLATRKKNGAK